MREIEIRGSPQLGSFAAESVATHAGSITSRRTPALIVA
jgi:hypothetical protein